MARFLIVRLAATPVPTTLVGRARWSDVVADAIKRYDSARRHHRGAVVVAGSGPAGDDRGPTPVLTGHVQRAWGLVSRRVQTGHGEGGAAVGNHPQGGPGQAPVAPLVPDEVPHQRPADDPGPAVALHAVQRQVAFHGDAGRIAPDRQPPPATILHRHANGEAKMTARPLAVLDTALDGGRLGPVGAAVLLGPDEAPLVGTAGRQAAVPDRRFGGPELLQGRGDRLGDRPVAVPEPPVGRLEVDADAGGHTAGVAAKAGAAPVDRPGGIAGAVDD